MPEKTKRSKYYLIIQTFSIIHTLLLVNWVQHENIDNVLAY